MLLALVEREVLEVLEALIVLVALEALESVSVAVSLASGVLSASTGTVKVLVVSPAAKVNVPLAAV